MEDSKIIGLLFRRNEQALTELRTSYGKMMHGVALHITGDASDAEEIVDDALLSVWNSVPPELPASLPAYVIRLTRNCAIDRYRANRLRSACVSHPIEELEEFLPDAEDLSDTQAIRRALEVFLGSLDEKGRAIFIRRYWGCEDIRSIAAATKLTVAGVSGRLHRMRKLLEQTLKKEGVEL